MSKNNDILGVNTRWLPSYVVKLNQTVGYCVVLVAGDIGDYAAYAGLVRGVNGNPTEAEIDFIRRLGNKISFQEADVHFPGQLFSGKYRI